MDLGDRVNLVTAPYLTKELIQAQRGDDKKINKPTSGELALGELGLALCCISYNNEHIAGSEDGQQNDSRLTGNKSYQDELCDQFDVARNDIEIAADDKTSVDARLAKATNGKPLRIWSDTFTWNSKELIESQAITGFVKGLPTGCDFKPVSAADKDTFIDAIPFVCFRGSTSIFDFQRDLKAARTTHLYTSKGRIAGLCGEGFFEMHSELLKPQYPKRATAAYSDDPLVGSEKAAITLIDVVMHSMKITGNRGLIISGHSLGGAVSTLFFAEMLFDDKFKESCGEENVRVVTFGSPRAVDLRLAHRLDQSPAIHLRFVNDNDVVTSGPTKDMQMFYHWGKAFFAPIERISEWNNWIVVYDPKRAYFGHHSDHHPPHQERLEFIDFGVDRLKNNYGFAQEVSDCIRDGFAPHKLTEKKGYGGQFSAQLLERALKGSDIHMKENNDSRRKYRDEASRKEARASFINSMSDVFNNTYTIVAITAIVAVAVKMYFGSSK